MLVHVMVINFQFFLKIFYLGDTGHGWNWEEEDCFAGVGSFKALFDNIQQGIFCPVVQPSAKKRQARKINDLRKYYANLEGLTIDEDQEVRFEDVTEIAIPVEGWSVDLEVHVESHLQEVCSKLSENFKGRLKVPPLALEAVRVFNRDNYEWLDEEEVEENAGEGEERAGSSTVSCLSLGGVGTSRASLRSGGEKQGGAAHSTDFPHTPSNLSKAREFLQELKGKSLRYFQEQWDKVLEGYLEFAKVASKLTNESLELKYQKFKQTRGSQLKTKMFCLYFEWLQLKSFSEAYAETVGSIMVISTGKGKHCQRENLGKNICLNFNLPPMHILNLEFVPEIAKDMIKSKELRFFRKLEFMAPSKIKMLVNSSLSASLHNFRKEREETSMRLPLQLFITPAEAADDQLDGRG